MPQLNNSWTGKQLTNVTTSSSIYSYEYNQNGLRIKKTNISNNTYVTYSYEGDKLIKQYDGTNKVFYLYDDNGVLYGLIWNGTKYFYRRNVIGEIIDIIDINCNVVVTYTYDPYGKLMSTSGSLASTLGIINSMLYKGYVYDRETQLFYCNSRYYSPELCRWISPDSIKYLSPSSINGLNLYSYCDGNPINRFDPSGTFWISLLVGMAIGAAIGFATAAYSDYKEDKVWFNGQWQDYAFEVGLGAFTGAIGGGVGSLFHTSNFIAGFALSTVIGAGTQIASDAYYGNLNSSSEWSDWVLSGLKGAIVSGISYSISYGVTRLMASNAFAGIIGKNTSNNKINKALSSAGLSSKIGRDGKNVVIREIMNGDSMGVFNTLFSGWVDFIIGVLF